MRREYIRTTLAPSPDPEVRLPVALKRLLARQQARDDICARTQPTSAVPYEKKKESGDGTPSAAPLHLLYTNLE
jgi:hypothetical protein